MEKLFQNIFAYFLVLGPTVLYILGYEKLAGIVFIVFITLLVVALFPKFFFGDKDN